MQKLILLSLFLSCFEIQNVLGNEPPPEPPIVEPPPPPPIQDCWDGNKCLKDSHCGKNGKCTYFALLRDSVGYVHLQKFKEHFQF